MVTLQVMPRQTPAERATDEIEVEVDDRHADHASIIEDWATPRQNWEFTLREGHEFGRANNVEGQLLFVQGEQTSSLSFRLEQLDAVDEVLGELVLRFEESDGIARVAVCTANGLNVELFHILTFT